MLSVGLRMSVLCMIVWALTGPIDRSPLTVGAAALPPAAGQSGYALQAPQFFPETGYIVTTSPIGQYFAARGGARTFGPPISNEFTLVGARVQIFRDFVLRQDAYGTVSTVDLHAMNAVPFRNVGGRTVPEIDQRLLATAPSPALPDYGAQVQAFIKANAPDTFEGVPVGFYKAFQGTVRFEDAFPEGTGERGLLTGFAQEVWGLPVSRPQRDPGQPNVIALRWERGTMIFDSLTNVVSAAPLGQAFRAVVTGEGLTPEQAALTTAAGSPFLSQANGPLPSGVARPAELPDTALAEAFKPNGSVEAGAVAAQMNATPTIEGWYVPSTATPTPFGFVGPGGGFATPTSTPFGFTGPPNSGNIQQPGGQGMPGAINPGAAGAAAGSDPCYGDEEITFSPEIPRVGNEVLIAVTSSRPHPYGRLAGTEKTTFVRERPGQKGYVWEWTIQLSYPGNHEYTFYVDSTIPCKKLQLTIRQGLATRTATPTKTATPYNWNNNDNNNNDNNNNNNDNNNDAKAPAIYAAGYVIPGQDVYGCNSFQSQAQAQSVLRYDPSDPNRLDAEDGVEDGIACSTYNYSFYPNDRDFTVVNRTYGTATPAATATVKPFAASDYLNQGDRYGCNDFAVNGRSQANAQAVLRADPNDPNKLDSFVDGVACGGVEAANDGVNSGAMPGPYDGTPVPTPNGGRRQ